MTALILSSCCMITTIQLQSQYHSRCQSRHSFCNLSSLPPHQRLETAVWKKPSSRTVNGENREKAINNKNFADRTAHCISRTLLHSSNPGQIFVDSIGNCYAKLDAVTECNAGPVVASKEQPRRTFQSFLQSG
jgi:hypothetical protein